jgi:uncharacterized protein (DUF1778 family)
MLAHVTLRERKEKTLRFRATRAQAETLRGAATCAGLSLSSWLLSVGLREAAQVAQVAQVSKDIELWPETLDEDVVDRND